MKWYLLCVLALLLATSFLEGKEPPKLPGGGPPEVALAEAVEKDGSVRLRLWVPLSASGPVRRTVDRNGKKVDVTAYAMQYVKWSILNLEADGKQVQAFDVKGKKIAPEKLPTLLAKRTPVALFKDDVPDPYFLRVLRPGTVVLQVPQEQFLPKRTPAPKADPIQPIRKD